MAVFLEDLSDLTTGSNLRRSRVILGKERSMEEMSQLVKGIIAKNAQKENLILFLRRHWINLFIQLFPFVALVILLIISYLLFHYFVGVEVLNEFERSIARLAAALFSLFLWGFIFIVFIDYYLDIWIVTNERIVNIEQKGLFRREISELRLEKVQDITTEITGFICTFYDFGDLYVQTAGKRERFLFKSIPHPERVRNVILVLSEEN